MSKNSMVKSLNTLVNLRGREVDRLHSEMAAKQVIRERFENNLARIQALCSVPTVQGAHLMSLSMNRAGYNQALQRVISDHRQDLALHEADMAVTQRALTAAAQKREVLDQVLEVQRRQMQIDQGRRDQKREDDLASQVWWRGQN